MYQQRHSLRPQAASILTLLLLTGIILFSLTISPLPPTLYLDNANLAFEREFPRKIWQTWQTFEHSSQSQSMDDESQWLSKTWKDMNPEHRYELLTTGSASTYVQDHFKDQPEIVETFQRLGDPILRADLIRYITLLAEGGVYSDLDTDPTRPIRDWIAEEFLNRTNLVLGIEYDARGEEVIHYMKLPVQICQWTLMSKPGHPVIQHLLNRVVGELNALGQGQEQIIPRTEDDVMDTTGPRVFTTAVLEALTARTGRPVTFQDLAFIDTPKLIGDVLILPVNAFGSGQEHSGSKPWGNEEQLMSHHWNGWRGWKKRLNS